MTMATTVKQGIKHLLKKTKNIIVVDPKAEYVKDSLYLGRDSFGNEMNFLEPAETSTTRLIMGKLRVD